MLEVIEEKMKVRARGFVNSRLVYRKASGKDPIDKQTAYAGSLETERFTGWLEQVGRRKSDRKRIFAGKGRNRGGQGVAKQQYRFTRNKDIPHNIDGHESTDYMELANGDPARAAVIMTAMLKRAGYTNKPFVIEGAHVNDGVYSMTPGGKLRWVATIEGDKDVKEIPWHTMALKRALAQKDPAVEFNKNLQSLLQRKAGRLRKGSGL